MRFAVIGAGMAGILSAIKLDEAGLTDFTVYEKGDRLGGTWRENTYPGLACDVPSHLYSYSFALTPEWSHRYSPGPEIYGYFERVARDHDVIRYMRFGDEVTACTFTNGRWQLETASGHRDEVDVVIARPACCTNLGTPTSRASTRSQVRASTAHAGTTASTSTAPASGSSAPGRPRCRWWVRSRSASRS